jgi:hypothetical protein
MRMSGAGSIRLAVVPVSFSEKALPPREQDPGRRAPSIPIREAMELRPASGACARGQRRCYGCLVRGGAVKGWLVWDDGTLSTHTLRLRFPSAAHRWMPGSKRVLMS